ncbi:MAG: hypothetical protein R3293_12805 [Candidatus Promineifilaceae bacterium]|nr:hypothetical protein [Candidatus Promineifilaceae bacterium]
MVHISVEPPAEAVTAAEDKIANAMSAGPAAIAQDAAILDYPEEWPGNWLDEPAPQLVENVPAPTVGTASSTYPTRRAMIPCA